MKKVLACFLTVLFLLSSAVFTVSAEESDDVNISRIVKSEDGTTVTYFEDGSTLTLSSARRIESPVAPCATAETVSGNKVATFTDSSGNVEWKYTLTASFSYVKGSSSTCTNASYTKEIYESMWSFSNGSATRSGNSANGKGKFVYKILFITGKTCNIDLSITCDTYGNLS